MTNTTDPPVDQYIIIKGWIHPKIGDDYPFIRGFVIPGNRPLVHFKAHFIKNLNKQSQIPDDCFFELVSKEEWNKLFKNPKQ